MATTEQPATGSLPSAASGQGALPLDTPRRVTLVRLARRNPVGVAALLIVLAFVMLGIVQVCSYGVSGSALTPDDPGQLNAAAQLEGPSFAHPFGTNKLGQDVFSRVLAGARVSFLIGLVAVAGGFVPGAFLGIVSGYYRRWVDYVIQRSGEAWASFPVLVLYLAFITAFGQGLRTIIMIVAISALVGGSRVLRAATIVAERNDFVEGARAIGATDMRILLRHIFPSVMPVIIVGASGVFAVSVLAEAALSFLGLGVSADTPSWGIDLSGENLRLARFYPHLVIFPGIAISLVVLGFNLLGDTLRDILDPRLRGALR